jgi:hypothetical protein
MLVLRFEATDEKNLENIKTIVEKKVAESIREVKPVRRKRIMD